MLTKKVLLEAFAEYREKQPDEGLDGLQIKLLRQFFETEAYKATGSDRVIYFTKFKEFTAAHGHNPRNLFGEAFLNRKSAAAELFKVFIGTAPGIQEINRHIASFLVRKDAVAFFQSSRAHNEANVFHYTRWKRLILAFSRELSLKIKPEDMDKLAQSGFRINFREFYANLRKMNSANNWSLKSTDLYFLSGSLEAAKFMLASPEFQSYIPPQRQMDTIAVTRTLAAILCSGNVGMLEAALETIPRMRGFIERNYIVLSDGYGPIYYAAISGRPVMLARVLGIIEPQRYLERIPSTFSLQIIGGAVYSKSPETLAYVLNLPRIKQHLSKRELLYSDRPRIDIENYLEQALEIKAGAEMVKVLLDAGCHPTNHGNVTIINRIRNLPKKDPVRQLLEAKTAELGAGGRASSGPSP